jgi:hypothetical protein
MDEGLVRLVESATNFTLLCEETSDDGLATAFDCSNDR